jgi:hypothetical protein
MARSGDQDPIPHGFVADLLSQAPRSSHGRDVEVGGGFAGSRRAPSPALRVGLARSNSASAASGVLPGAVRGGVRRRPVRGPLL